LSSDDIFLDGWDENYVVQSAVWDNSKTWLFWVTPRGERLNHEIIAVMLVA
jgi:hypothetical protein